MLPNSAYTLVPIVKGTDYSPSMMTAAHVDPNLGPTSPAGPTVNVGLSAPIFGLFCTASTGAGNVIIRALGNDSDITIPSAAFKQGVVYYIYLKELVDDDGGTVTFVGYKYAAHPLNY